jgi:hypothetical protein
MNQKIYGINLNKKMLDLEVNLPNNEILVEQYLLEY